MDAIHTNHNCTDKPILKSNLWKFFKTLRTQANPVYCLLAASPIHYAWITIVDKNDSNSQKRITIAQFINSLKKMPLTGKLYQLAINTYSSTESGKKGNITYEAIFLQQLSVEIIDRELPSIIAFHCIESIKQGLHFELTPQTILHYKFKARYIDELKTIIQQCNDAIKINNTLINHKK